MRPAVRPIAIAGALAMALVLVGCSTPPPSGGTSGNGGSGGTNGRPGTSEDDSGTGSGSGTDDADTDDTGSDDGEPLTGRLPADWPAEVVVPDGEIVQALSMGTSWLALINVDDTTTAFASSSASLQAVGFTVVSEVVTDHGSVGIYENAELQVQISAATDPEAGWTMSYTITEKS